MPASRSSEIQTPVSSHEDPSTPRLRWDVRNDPNYCLVEEDLKTTQTVEFVTMLRAMILLKRVREDRHNEDENANFNENEDENEKKTGEVEETLSADALEAHGTQELRTLVTEAVAFCNDATRSRGVKEALAEALQTPSVAQRCPPLATAFNAILADFRDRAIGSLEQCSAEDETLYTVNDPLGAGVQSSRLSRITGEGEGGPGICEVPRTRLLSLNLRELGPEGSRTGEQAQSLDGKSLGGFKAEDIQAHLEDRQNVRESDETRLQWRDVVHCVEVRASACGVMREFPPRFREPYALSAVLALVESDALTKPPQSASNTTPVTPPYTGSKVQKKRTASPLSDQPTKRSKTFSSNIIHSGHSSHSIHSSHPDSAHQTDLQGQNASQAQARALQPDIQCAFYGIELLRATWDKTHSIVTLISDTHLSLHWYDAQGCVSTAPICIAEHLPLVVALLVLFQRFKRPMRGHAHGEGGVGLEIPLGDENGKGTVKFGIPADVETRWEMKGRRSVTCVPVPVEPTLPLPILPRPASAEDPGPEPHKNPLTSLFLKWTWRPSTRPPEAHIISTAKARAERFLGEHKDDVVLHIPDVRYAREYPSLSTARIRGYCGLSQKEGCSESKEGKKEARDEARVPSLMVSRRMARLESVQGGLVNGGKVWEVLRCIVLLWRLGIAHRDISLGNIMVSKSPSPFTPTSGASFNANSNSNSNKSNSDSNKSNSDSDESEWRLVLNDFDMAALMEPGDVSPTPERAEGVVHGTQPFMAVELLLHAAAATNGDGRVQAAHNPKTTHNADTSRHLCRHDLESVIWVLAWMCLRDERWATRPPGEVASFKAAWGVWAVPRDVDDGEGTGTGTGTGKQEEKEEKGIDKKDNAQWNAAMSMSAAWMSKWGAAHVRRRLGELTERDVLDAVREGVPCPDVCGAWRWDEFRVQAEGR